MARAGALLFCGNGSNLGGLRRNSIPSVVGKGKFGVAAIIQAFWSFEICLVAQFGHHLTAVYVNELVTMSVQKADAERFLARTEVRRLKFKVIEDVTSKWRLVHLLASEQCKESLDYFIWNDPPTVFYRA